MGRFTAGFGTKSGNPISRSGYMVSCKRASDCYSRCPAHVLTGKRYQCQKRYKLYDVAHTDDDGNIELIDLPEGNTGAFDPDPATQAITGEYGICVDMDSAMHQGCSDQTMSSIVDGAIGCFDQRVSMFLCGLEVDIKDGDITTASIQGNFLYLPPRVLVAAGADHDGDGNPSPAITCSDPIGCQNVRTHHTLEPKPNPNPKPKPKKLMLAEMSILGKDEFSRGGSSSCMCIVRLLPFEPALESLAT